MTATLTPVVNQRYPCCGRTARLNANQRHSGTVTRTCHNCQRAWTMHIAVHHRGEMAYLAVYWQPRKRIYRRKAAD